MDRSRGSTSCHLGGGMAGVTRDRLKEPQSFSECVDSLCLLPRLPKSLRLLQRGNQLASAVSLRLQKHAKNLVRNVSYFNCFALRRRPPLLLMMLQRLHGHYGVIVIKNRAWF